MNPNESLRQRLRNLASLQPSDASVQRATAAVRAAVQQESFNQQTSSLGRMVMTHKKISLAAAIGSLAVVAAAWMLLADRGGVAFAQVVEQLQRVKTVQYTETRSHLPRPGKPAGPTTVTKYWIQGRSQQRQEIVSTTKGDPLPEGRAWSIAPVGMASVSNLVTGKTVSLDTKEKVFSEIKGFLSIDPDTGELNETKPHPMPEVDFYRQIRDFPADEAERLPEQTLDDRKVVGFRTVESNERPGGVDSWTRTYWVDAESNLPVQVEVTFTSTQPTMGHSKWVLSDIVFDEPLDESLFSTEPPEGYTVREE